MNPMNIDEAIEYLSKNENGLYQHIFHSNSKNKNKCQICGEMKVNHIGKYEKSITDSNINNTSMDFSYKC